MNYDEVRARFPDTVTPRSGLIAWGDIDPETGCIGMYDAFGRLDYILGPDCKELAPPEQFGPPTPGHFLLHMLADRANHFAKCYFIGGDSGPVKIGYSVDVKGRLAALQLASPVRLQVLALANGGAAREAAYHAQFAHVRLHGEWFERTVEIEREIGRLNTPAPNNAPPPARR